ncbi:hypothetical protein ACOQFL_02490 [Actinopolyspora sp. H202]|uniref:hypothetical protein n=1 Tax=Actinopolyspora sp. H202 TaxID=1500456 RepID=UPI003EE645F5
MPQSGTISDSVSAVAALLRTGNVRDARRQWSETMSSAEQDERAALTECARILAHYPRTALTRLRAYWRQADERTRAVIEACAPTPEEHRKQTEPQPDRSPRWDRRAIEGARARRRTGGTVRTTTDPQHRSTPPQNRARARRVMREEAATTHDYLDARAGVDDAPARGAQPDGYAINYEDMAVYPDARDTERRDPRTTPARDGQCCIALGCQLITSHADLRVGDGLCEECRDVGRPGLDVSATASHTQMIEARCAYLAEYYPYPTKHLRTLWQQANQADRDTIAQWVTTNLPTEQAAAPSELTPCEQCGTRRNPRDLARVNTDDGECRACRTDAEQLTAATV